MAVDPGVYDIQENGKWRRFKLAGIPLDGYATTGGLELLAKQIVVEYPTLQLEIMRIGWFSSERTLREGHKSGRFRTASEVFAVRDSIMASEIVKGGIRLGGRKVVPATFVEGIQTAQCETRCRWGHIGASRHREEVQLCAGNHATTEHQ